jgi:hypothetical protein
MSSHSSCGNVPVESATSRSATIITSSLVRNARPSRPRSARPWTISKKCWAVATAAAQPPESERHPSPSGRKPLDSRDCVRPGDSDFPCRDFHPLEETTHTLLVAHRPRFPRAHTYRFVFQEGNRLGRSVALHGCADRCFGGSHLIRCVAQPNSD